MVSLHTYTRIMLIIAAASLIAVGCKSKTDSSSAAIEMTTVVPIQTPPRPAVGPAPFKVFHKSDTTYTLVVPEDATDEQV